MLDNPGARMMELGIGEKEGAEDVLPLTDASIVDMENKPEPEPEPVKPVLTVEEMNEKMEVYGGALREEVLLRKGDLVTLNDMANSLDVDFPIKEGQKAMVALFGNEVKPLSDSPFSNTILRFIDKDNRVNEILISSMYLEKVGTIQTEKQKSNKK